MTDAALADAANNVAEAPATTPAAQEATSTSAPIKLYAQYCFHLSPTLNAWCPMRVADVVRLDQYAEFEGQNVFFHMNHPIKWVRIAGVVVACNEFHTRRVYLVDDGSGETIECVYDPPRPSKAAATLQQQQKQQTPAVPTIDRPGSIINVKGELKTYRGCVQVHIVKMALVRSTEQEVQFWAKTAAFAKETLYKPWVVDRKMVRKCRQAAMAVQRAKDVEEVRKEMAKEKEEKARKEREEKEMAERRRNETELERWERGLDEDEMELE